MEARDSRLRIAVAPRRHASRPRVLPRRHVERRIGRTGLSLKTQVRPRRAFAKPSPITPWLVRLQSGNPGNSISCPSSAATRWSTVGGGDRIVDDFADDSDLWCTDGGTGR